MMRQRSGVYHLRGAIKLKRRIVKITLGIFLIAVLAVGLWVYKVLSAIPEMFERNGQLQAEGYYTGEFEFKMLGCAYYLDHGKYITAIRRLSELQEQQQTRRGLIRVPQFTDKRAEMEFYLRLQNPRTGAFMDEAYPAVFYYEPTANVINHLELLARETGQPFHLRYPLRFMQDFDSPNELTTCLNDLATVGWIGARLPKTCYILATQFCSYEDFERLGLYNFSPAWKKSLLKWFADNQDAVTGTWGPRDRHTGQLLNAGDINTTYHVIKLFVNDKGQDKAAAFPLRHRRELFATVVDQAAMPMPDDSSAAELHDWNLCRTQGVKMLTAYLWQDVSAADRSKARDMMARLVSNRFEKFYRPGEGGFSYYPSVKKASLDGTGSAVYLLKNVGALSDNTRMALWGTPAQTMENLGERRVKEISGDELRAVNSLADINSIRIFASMPEQDFAAGMRCIVYPRATRVLDTADLMPRIVGWLEKTPQSMGNWTSREELYQDLTVKEWPAVQVCQGNQGLGPANKLLRENGEVVLVGFDVLQVPRAVITFKLAQ